ncbi:uncharacterized protein LOC124160391 [Ischnura elegans]|uniref:uncharacterized protein LOC124160391 n=1 Tax=Ischnura elegans TaxID=197161 RepID=UPI001ED8BB2F|nr:uncharacterized protein LOC124160391 [Ischnura elegans]
MKVVAVLLATLAVASATLYAGGAPVLGAPLLPKVRYNAAEVSVVKQPVEVQQPEVTYRNVPVPYSVPYAVPYSVPYPVKVPVAHPVPVHVGHHAYAAPIGYGYGLPYGFAAPAVVKA